MHRVPAWRYYGRGRAVRERSPPTWAANRIFGRIAAALSSTTWRGACLMVSESSNTPSTQQHTYKYSQNTVPWPHFLVSYTNHVVRWLVLAVFYVGYCSLCPLNIVILLHASCMFRKFRLVRRIDQKNGYTARRTTRPPQISMGISPHYRKAQSGKTLDSIRSIHWV